MSDRKENYWDVVIIGAGAAGLHCAALSAKRGLKVLVLDHANKPGKKILMSGGGRCNFTNYYIEPDCYLSENPHFCKSALSRYTQWDFISLVEKYSVQYHEKKNGQLFCDNKASDVLNVLLKECERNNVQINVKEPIVDIHSEHNKSSDYRFSIHTNKDHYLCNSLVVATGGPSIPTMGASSFGYDIAKQFGLNIVTPRAALVPFTVSDHWKDVCHRLSGTSCSISVCSNGKTFSDDMLFTHRGLSGPAMLQISSYWKDGQTLSIDLLPNIDAAKVLRTQQHKRPKLEVKTWLSEQTTQKFAEQWLTASDLNSLMKAPLCNLTGDQMDDLARNLHEWKMKPSGTEGYRTAEVALGGVATEELSSKTMESNRVAGLFFIGEVVDVTGHLGGFNFQWAWSSAAAAAEFV